MSALASASCCSKKAGASLPESRAEVIGFMVTRRRMTATSKLWVMATTQV
jgi:hypothetical protein